MLKRYREGWDSKGIITGLKPDFILPELRIPRNHPWPLAHKREWEARYKHSGTLESRIQFLVVNVGRALKSINHEGGFLVESWFPTDPDMQVEIPSEILEQVEKLDSRFRLFLSFQDHANHWIKTQDEYYSDLSESMD